jgi:hypothetical protein
MKSSLIKKLALYGALTLFVAVVAMLIIFRHDIANNLALAAGNRAIARHVVTPLDLTGQYTAPGDVFDGDGYWGDVPNGFQVFDHVPFQIDGLMCLWGAGNAKAGADFPEAVTGIPVNQKFEALYIYHGAFYSAPDRTPVCEVVFRYDDGTSATNQLLYGSDMLDFVIDHSNHPRGPTGARTKSAWVGASFSQTRTEPLRFSVTAIDNPYNYLTVKTIDVYSCKSRTAACILAMTTGKAGLLR